MLSDIIADAEQALRNHQKQAQLYPPINDQIDALRCQMVALQMILDSDVPLELLARNPIYQGAIAGDIEPHDRFMGGDNSVLDEFRAMLAERRRG